ncbi:hypothetical protein Ndes2526B_g03394 [Nannochloris sp. 'desiccata']
MSGQQPSKDIKDALSALFLADENQPKQSYAFWGTQPVAQFNEASNTIEAADGPIDQPKTVADVRPDPLPLPPTFEWSTCDVNDPVQLKEIYELLSLHYVEDDENMFRFDYSPQFLHWALQPPGYKQEWHCGVRASRTGKLLAFISAIPAVVRVRDQDLKVVEINFLCVHKKLRQKRLAPVLIKEITRRVNLQNIWQAVYTAGVVLPKPVTEGQYWHRILNPKKLIAVGFSRLASRMTMARTIKLYKLPEKPLTPGLRPMEPRDVPAVTSILKKYLEQYKLAPCFDKDEVHHWLVPREDVVTAYVVENPETKAVTDLVSFYTLPSTVIGNEQYKSLKAAYMFYTVPVTASARQLLNDALILAQSTGHDVFNALDIFENEGLLKDLKFGIGDGKLRYYLFNWRTAEMKANEACHARRLHSRPLFRLLISNGSTAQFQASPYICSIRHRATGRHFCGGVLLGPRSVLTAAYCVSPIALNINPEVWCGNILDINNSSHGAVDAVRAVKTTVHECFDPRRYFNDIAVLELNTSVVHGKAIESIIEVKDFESLKNGDELIGFGWGKTETTLPINLQQAVLPFIPHQECNTAEIYNSTVDAGSMFCAGYFDGRADTCAGDSGGPLVQKEHKNSGSTGRSAPATDSNRSSDDTLVGIVSWGSGCASNGSFPGVYARVDIHHEWIVLHSHCACTRTFSSSGSFHFIDGSRDSNMSSLQSSRRNSGEINECILLEESGEVHTVEHKADASVAYTQPPGLCYVVDFERCPVATASKVYLGQGWLPCRKNREGEIEPIHNATSCSYRDGSGG